MTRTYQDDVTSPSGGGDGKHKSLKQREEEYAQARLRILGSAEPSQAEPSGSSQPELEANPDCPENLAVIDPSLANKNVVRMPSGPDGTKGFKLKR